MCKCWQSVLYVCVAIVGMFAYICIFEVCRERDGFNFVLVETFFGQKAKRIWTTRAVDLDVIKCETLY